MINKNTKIAVLLGGLSGEKEISRQSGMNILEALQAKGYTAFPLEMNRELAFQLKETGAEVAFNGLHGAYGEDGCVQGLLEIMAIPYTGSGVMASAVAMDKVLSKRLALNLGVKTPAFLEIKKGEVISEASLNKAGLVYPLIVKPSGEGSSLGLAKVENFAELKKALADCQERPGSILIEEYIQGRELTVGWVEGQAMPVLEVISLNGFYDYEAKYVSEETRYECPANLSPSVAQSLQETSLQLIQKFQIQGVARVDFLLNFVGEAYFLEINTLPGMTSHSLVPKAAKVAGLSFEDLVEKILLSARLKQS